MYTAQRVAALEFTLKLAMQPWVEESLDDQLLADPPNEEHA